MTFGLEKGPGCLDPAVSGHAHPSDGWVPTCLWTSAITCPELASYQHRLRSNPGCSSSSRWSTEELARQASLGLRPAHRAAEHNHPSPWSGRRMFGCRTGRSYSPANRCLPPSRGGLPQLWARLRSRPPLLAVTSLERAIDAGARDLPRACNSRQTDLLWAKGCLPSITAILA